MGEIRCVLCAPIRHGEGAKETKAINICVAVILFFFFFFYFLLLKIFLKTMDWLPLARNDG